MKKLIIKVLQILLLIFQLNGNESKVLCGLEVLWDYAEKNNYDIAAAKLNEKNSVENYKKYWKKKLPSVSTFSSYSLDSFSSRNSTCSGELMSSIAITEDFRNGTGITLNPTILFSRDFLSESFRTNRTEFLDSAEVGFGIYQNLYPYWLQGQKTNPDKKNELLKTKEAECLKKMEIKKSFEKITDLYIEYRTINRNLDCIQDYINFLIEKKKAFEDLKKTGDISILEISKLDDEIQTYCSDYLDYIHSKEIVRNQIFSETGFTSKDEELFANINFFDTLPSDFSYEDTNPEVEYYQIQRDILLNDLIISRQRNAPIAKIEIDFPLYEKKREAFFDLISASNKCTARLSIDFVPTDSQSKRMDEYIEWDKLYERKIKAIETNINREKNSFFEQEIKIKEMLSFYEKILSEKTKIKEAMENFFEHKNCNFIQVMEARINQQLILTKLENLKDEKWYCGWMIKNRY